jgi:thiol-disulfide isomerase/thioredoxin
VSPPQTARRLAAGLALAALLTGCATTTGDAGVRVTPSDSPTSSSGSTPGASAPADLVASAGLADCPASDPKATELDDGLPDVVLPCLGDGPGVRLAGLRGTPTVVNVWASWCGPCREELTLFADLAGSAGTAVRVLGVDATDDPPSALSLLTDAGVHYASVRDDTGVTKAPMGWGSGLPVTYFVDAEGRVAFTRHGAIASADEMNRLVAEHLGVTVPA